MTENEAIKIFNDLLDVPCEMLIKYDSVINSEKKQALVRLRTAEEFAIKALEKQIPKKPKKSQSKLRYLGTYMCPSCGGDFSGTGVASYCYHCGQRFKWNDAEDWSDGE